MKKIKKIAAVLICTSMVLSMVACSSPQGDASEDPEGEATGYTEITFWNSMDTSYGEILAEQIENFNNTIGEEKKIKVTSVFQSYPGTEALTAAISSDDTENMPDVIQLYSESVSLVRDYERTVWAEDMMNENGASIKKDDFIPNVLNSFVVEDRLIGVPYNIACYLLYYNKDQLAQAGYSEPPATIQEMTEMLPNLVEKTDADYGLNVRINMNELINFVETQGADGSLFGDNDNGHAGYMTKLQCEEDGTLKNFIDAWGAVIDTGCYKAVRDSINEEFAAGMHSMVIMSSSRMRTIEDLVGDSFEWGVAAVPTVSEGDSPASFPTGSGLFVLDRGIPEKIDAAWEFVQYMASPEIQAQWVETTGYIPVNKNALEAESYKKVVEEMPMMSVPCEILINSPMRVTSPFVPNYQAIDTLIKDTMISYANKEIDAEEAYTAIIEGAKKTFEEYYRSNPIK